MNWDQVQGKWKQYKGEVKEKWGKLTDDDIDLIDGKRQQLVGKLQQRYGLAKDEAEDQADRFINGIDTTGNRQEDRELRREEERGKARRAGQH